jgi:hypothetical protein
MTSVQQEEAAQDIEDPVVDDLEAALEAVDAPGSPPGAVGDKVEEPRESEKIALMPTPPASGASRARELSLSTSLSLTLSQSLRPTHRTAHRGALSASLSLCPLPPRSRSGGFVSFRSAANDAPPLQPQARPPARRPRATRRSASCRRPRAEGHRTWWPRRARSARSRRTWSA